jgi:hypothetical protein
MKTLIYDAKTCTTRHTTIFEDFVSSHHFLEWFEGLLELFLVPITIMRRILKETLFNIFDCEVILQDLKAK